jgi:hypothetical protein
MEMVMVMVMDGGGDGDGWAAGDSVKILRDGRILIYLTQEFCAVTLYPVVP